MEKILDNVSDALDGQIDFRGQRRAENLSTYLLILSAFMAFSVGYALQDIKLAVYVGLGGTATTSLICVPAWSFYKRNPVKWLPAGATTGAG